MGRVHRHRTGAGRRRCLGIVEAAAASRRHAAAILYDFHHRFHQPPSAFKPHDKLLLVVGLLRDRSSHTYAAHQGWLFPPSEAAQIAYWQLEVEDYRGYVQAKKAAQWKPLPRPWEPAKQAPVMTRDLRNMLLERARSQTTEQ